MYWQAALGATHARQASGRGRIRTTHRAKGGTPHARRHRAEGRHAGQAGATRLFSRGRLDIQRGRCAPPARPARQAQASERASKTAKGDGQTHNRGKDSTTSTTEGRQHNRGETAQQTARGDTKAAAHLSRGRLNVEEGGAADLEASALEAPAEREGGRAGEGQRGRSGLTHAWRSASPNKQQQQQRRRRRQQQRWRGQQ